MNKIVELLIDWDEMDFSELGVDIMSLVSEPAIGISWQKFAAQKFVEVKPGESEDEYVSRCIPVLIEEGFDQDQAAAIEGLLPAVLPSTTEGGFGEVGDLRQTSREQRCAQTKHEPQLSHDA